jgi:hypothetical protein
VVSRVAGAPDADAAPGFTVREEALRRLGAGLAAFARVSGFIAEPLRSVNGGGFALLRGIRQVS